MDDLPGQGHAEESDAGRKPDREAADSEAPDSEAAASLAEMATALAEASTVPAGEAIPPEPADAGQIPPEVTEKEPGRFARALRAGRSASPRRWVGAGLEKLRTRLNARSWDGARRTARRAIGLGLTVALLLASSGSAAPLSGFVPGPSPEASATATAARPSPGVVSASASAHGSPAGSHVAASSKAHPTATPSEEPLPSSTSAAATITLRQLLLDSSTDPAGRPRSISFVSDGPGTVSAEIVQSSPLDSTRLCVAADGAEPECMTGATPGLTLGTAAAQSRWTVTLASPNESSPTVDVAITWHTAHPSVALSDFPFQGYPNPDSARTLKADFTTRVVGTLSVAAAWSRTSVDASLTLADVSGANPVPLGTAAYSRKMSMSPTYTHPLAAGRTYEMTLYNNGRDTGRTLLTATIAFP